MMDRRQYERFICQLDTMVIDRRGNEIDAIIRNVSLNGLGVELLINWEYNIGDSFEVYIDGDIFVSMQIVRKNPTEKRTWYYGLYGDDMTQDNLNRILLLSN